MTRRRRRARVPPEQRFITWFYWMLDAPAFLALRGNAVKLMAMLNKRYNGANNGEIAMSVREAAREVGCSSNHALSLFQELEAAGFIVATVRGAFSWKTRHASTWRLTWLPTNDSSAPSGVAAPTKDFMRAGACRQNPNGGRKA